MCCWHCVFLLWAIWVQLESLKAHGLLTKKAFPSWIPSRGRPAPRVGAIGRERSSFYQAISLIKRNLTSLWSHKNVLLAFSEGVCFGNSTVRISRAVAGSLCGVAWPGLSVPSFKSTSLPWKAVVFAQRSPVGFHSKWCPWMWLLFAFHWNIRYRAFAVEHLPGERARRRDWKASSLMQSGDMKDSSVLIASDPRSQRLGLLGSQNCLSPSGVTGILRPPFSQPCLCTGHVSCYFSNQRTCLDLSINNLEHC